MSENCEDETLLINEGDVPIYDQPTLPDGAKLIMFVDEDNFDYGGTISVAYRLPLSRVIPSSAYSGLTYSLNDDNAGISIPDQTVVPGYVEAFEPYGLNRAQASSETSKAQFLIVGTDQNIDNNYILQSTGFYRFPTTHNYVIGQQYYLSDSAPGGVTTVPPSPIAQKLFIPVDQSTIRIQIGE